jgi:hypothetical protein
MHVGIISSNKYFIEDKYNKNNLVKPKNRLHVKIHQNFSSILTYSMEHSPSWEANWFSDSQKIPRILWNPKVHHRIHKCPQPLPILSQLDPVALRPILILSSHLRLGLSSGLFPSGFPPKRCIWLSSPISATCTAHLIFFRNDHPNITGWGIQIIQLLIM